MKIFLDRYFNFYTKSSQPWVEVEVSQPTRLSEVLAGVGIPAAEVHFATINGEAVNPEGAVITESDRVKLYPPFGGG